MTETQTTTERQPNPDSGIQTPEEILDSDFHAVHARIYIAATDDGAKIEEIFNPEKKINRPSGDPSEKFLEEDQNYNGVTWGMSKKERQSSWEGVEYDTAMSQWKEGVYRSIHNSSHDNIVKGFFGKDKSEIERDTDIQKLYDTYCKGESNVTAFARKANSINASEEEAKWLARKLFGAKTAEVVVEIMELEKSINVNERETFNALFGDADKMKRINEPNDREKEIFKNIADGYAELSDNEKRKIKEAQKTPQSSGSGAPLEGSQEDKKKKEVEQLPELESNMIIINKSGERFYIKDIRTPDPVLSNDTGDYSMKANLNRLTDVNRPGPSPKYENLQRALIEEDSDYRFSIVEGKQIEYKGETYTAFARYLEKEKGEVVIIKQNGKKPKYIKRASFDEYRKNKTLKIIGIDDVEESEDKANPNNDQGSPSPELEVDKERERLVALANAGGTKEDIEAAQKALKDYDEAHAPEPPPDTDAGDGPNPEVEVDADHSDSDVDAPKDGVAKKK